MQIRPITDASAVKSTNARIYEGRAARIHGPGDPLRYSWGDAFRDAEGLDEIHQQLSSDVPVTLLHPPGMLMDGFKGRIVGGVVSSRRDGDHVVAKFYVTEPAAHDAIRNGMHELSLGYKSAYDAKSYQRKIRVDHLALVPKARCGPTCSLLTNRDCGGDCGCSGCSGGTFELDADERERLRAIASTLYDGRRLPDSSARSVAMDASDIAAMCREVVRIDGALTDYKNLDKRHPVFVAGLFLGALRRQEARQVAHASRDAQTAREVATDAARHESSKRHWEERARVELRERQFRFSNPNRSRRS
jgi:hypothetical protein